jgi:pantetheine-phosphate adenylyltransferase
MQRRYKLVATGGTFDVIHRGHLALLQKAFEVSESVIIGVTSDRFAAARGKKIVNNYIARTSDLSKLLDSAFKNRKYQLKELNEDFGPALYTSEVEALIASKETAHKGDLLNKLRVEKGLNHVDVVIVDLVLAKDGKRISSTRIRSGEIDSEGNLLSPQT